MKRIHAVLVALLGAAAVSCGSSPGGGTARAVNAPGHGTVSGAAASPSSKASGTSTNSTLTIDDGTSGGAAGATASQPGGAPGEPGVTAPGSGGATAPGGPPPPTPSRTPVTSGGWTLLAIYTAVESYHLGGDLQQVSGCALGAPLTCGNGTSDLGTYPGDFVSTVQAEGTGRITTGSHAGSYLAWDSVKGFSLATLPLDDNGTPLRAFVSAAADDGVSPMTHVKVLDCGVDTGTLQPSLPIVCTRFSTPDWVVVDRSGDPAGSHALSLYVGEENQPDFDFVTPYVTTTVGARVTLR